MSGPGGFEPPNENMPQPPQSPLNFKDPQHVLNNMNKRAISPQAIEQALQDIATWGNTEGGNIIYNGKNGVTVIVDPATSEIITVW